MFGRRKDKPLDPPAGPQEPAAPGWDAIDAVLQSRYGDQEPRHVGYTPPAAFSHNLQGCSAYRADGHWHYVTYGLSELYESGPEDDPAYSGWGFELTLRVGAAEPAGTEAPGWPFTVLNQLANYVHGQGRLLADGDWIDLRGPITGHPGVPEAPPTDLVAFVIAVDPELGRIATPNGEVTFLQLVGITESERAAAAAGTTEAVLEAIRHTDPLLATRLDRGPLL